MPEPTLDVTAAIDSLIPADFRGTTYTEDKNQAIAYWQAYLQPIISEPEEIAEADTYDITKWPFLTKHLIVRLAAYTMLINAINKLLIAVGNSKSVITDSSGTVTTVQPRQIKSIETGPGKTEWYEQKLETSEDAKNVAQAFNNMIAEDGPFQLLKQEICQLASRLLIYLPMCENPTNHHPGFKVIRPLRTLTRGLHQVYKVKSQG